MSVQPTPMKILVLSNLYPPDVMGGYELGCRQAVEALKRLGHTVRVLTTAPRRPVPPEPGVHRGLRLTEIWSDYLFQKSHPVTAHLMQSESHRINAANVHTLLTEIREFEPDVAYPWMLSGVGGLGLMATLEYLGVPWLWHLMDDVPRLLCESAGRLVPGFAREFERHLAGGRYLACSQQVVDEIERAGVPLGPNVEVLPNWVEGAPLPRSRPYRDGGTLRIATAAGSIDRRIEKGVDLLIEAAALLDAGGRGEFAVDIYGNVVDPWFAERIQALGLTDRVRLCGSRSQAELRALYSGYDLFAFPTRTREPFGFAALEAAAAGCVPVISSTCGIAEWFMHGVHLIKAPRSAEGFAAAFAAVQDGQIDLEPLGARLATVVGREFHLDVLAPRIEQALAAAAADRRPSRGTPDDAYRLALLAERLAKVLVQESLRASA